MAFESSASDLVPGDNNLASDIFVRDMESGSIVLASQLPSKVAMAKGVDYELGGISSNGQFVLFSAFCAATGSTAPATKQIFVRDTVAQITLWASSNVVVFNGTAFSGPNCYTPSMAPDGQNLTFVAVSTQSKTLLYHHAFQTGITTCFATNQAAFNQSASDYIAPSLSDDGRFAVYALSAYSNGATNQVYRWDALTGSNTLVSAAMDGAGPGNGDSTAPQITPGCPVHPVFQHGLEFDRPGCQRRLRIVPSRHGNGNDKTRQRPGHCRQGGGNGNVRWSHDCRRQMDRFRQRIRPTRLTGWQ
jgi:hypothetical protein